MKPAQLFWLAVAASIVIGVWMRLPALQAGFHTDDAVQVAMLRDEFGAERSMFDLFRFADGERDGLKLIETGYHPWWSQPNLRIAMFRPLASALIAFDYHAFGSNPVLPHAHSFLWWIAMVLAGALVLSRTLPLPSAALAVFLFCIHSSHSVPVAWLANRSTLVATTFGLLGLWFHLRFRQDGKRDARLLTLAAFCLALLGGEYGLPVLAYVFALELLDDKRTWGERVHALWPALVPLATVAVLRPLLGFGIRGSGYYVSPLESPRAYVQGALERIPALVGDLVFQINSLYWMFGSPWFDDLETSQKYQTYAGIAAIGALLLGVHLAARLRGGDIHQLRWLGLGALLAVIPGSTALPENRVLVASSFGAAAVAGSLMMGSLSSAFRFIRERRFVLASLLVLLILPIAYAHGYIARWRAIEHLRGFMGAAAVQRHWAATAQIPDEGARDRRVIIVTGADFTTIANLPWVRSLLGRPLVKSYWRLSGAVQVHEIQRIAPNAIELQVLSNELEDSMAGSLYRSAKLGFSPGDSFSMPGMRVEVLGVDDATLTPWSTRITFAHSLDDPRYLFLHSMPEGLRSFKMPRIGEKLRLPAPGPPHF
ncbi:MAG TPA: hypothetical protein VI072_26125 [Polyangiaceae bacterium]